MAKYYLFTLLYILTFYFYKSFHNEVSFVIDYLIHIKDLGLGILALDMELIITLFISFVYKSFIFLFYAAINFIIWFFYSIKIGWFNLIFFLPIKRFIILFIKNLTIFDNVMVFLKEYIFSLWGNFLKWSLPLKIYSFPAVVCFIAVSAVGIFFSQAIHFLVANKIGDLLLEKILLLITGVIPFSKKFIDPLKDRFAEEVKQIEYKVTRLRLDRFKKFKED